jgi:GNAT superfamily N-acetyltransferase
MGKRTASGLRPKSDRTGNQCQEHQATRLPRDQRSSDAGRDPITIPSYSLGAFAENGHCHGARRLNVGDDMIRIGWCDDPSEVDRLADFFAQNVTQSYISHSELQFGRAQAPDKWFPDLEAVFKAEIAERVPCAPGAQFRVARAYSDDALVGLAYVTFTFEVPIPFFILEDIVVGRSKRGAGIGQAMLDWIFARAKEEGIKRGFLESGKDNHDAHHFFERNGFEQVSIVMMAELAGR